MKGIPAYRWNDYLLEADILYSEQNHIRNSLSIFCLHLPGVVLHMKAYVRNAMVSLLQEHLVERDICKEIITMQLSKCYCLVINSVQYCETINLGQLPVGFIWEETVEPGVERHRSVSISTSTGRRGHSRHMQSTVRGRAWFLGNSEIFSVAATQGI